MDDRSTAGFIAFKVGISDRVNTALPIWMAEQAGFYTREGLKLETAIMAGGSAGATELQEGRLDVMRVGFSSVVRTNRGGGDVRCIAAMSNVMRFTFFSAAGVKTAAELKGGTIGVSTFGSESDTTVTFALRRLGLTRDDVVIKEYGGATRRLAALKSNEIQASAINEPVASQAVEQGSNVMVDLVAEEIPWLFSSIVVRTKDLANRRGVFEGFLKATIEGNYLALSDPRQAKVVLAKELALSDVRTIDVSYDDFKKQTPLNMEPSIQGAQNVLSELYPEESSPAEVYMDTGIIEDMKKRGFMDELQKKYRVHLR